MKLPEKAMFKWRYSRINDGWKMTRIGKDDIEIRDLNWSERFILWLYKHLGRSYYRNHPNKKFNPKYNNLKRRVGR